MAQTQYSQWGQAERMNRPGKHDNYPNIDIEFVSKSGEHHFGGDVKVSLMKNYQYYYMRKLEKLDELVRSEVLKPEKAHLFVPHDQVPGLRASVEADFAKKIILNPAEASTLTRQRDEWLSRIHETGISSEHYRIIMELCASPTDRHRIDIDRVSGLARDLDAAADYIDRQLGRSIQY